MSAVEGNASFNQVYPVISLTGEGRAEVLGAWGRGFEQEGAGGAGVVGGGRMGQFHLCAKTKNLLRGRI